MPGTLVITTLSDGTNSTSATNPIQGSAKAWVNFNGTGTPAIRASYNVSSITDNGTGDYTINFTNAFADANFAFIAQAGNGGASQTAGTSYTGGAPTTTSATLLVDNGAAAAQDREYVMAAVFR
jgi:hypothetical protein